MPTEQHILFPPFRLDTVNECLWQGERALALTPKAFAVLRYLVEHPGRLVTKEELLTAVWPKVYVSDAVLKVCVREIRKALGDQHKAPRFVETLHRRGYRFIAPLTTTQPIQSPKSEPVPSIVGREAAFAQLHGWLEKALSGERQFVFVDGEAGIGKTTVVEAFLERAATKQDLWIGRGQCVEHYGAGEAYLPVLEALGRLCHAPGGGQLVALLDRYAPTWLMQMPALLSSADRERLRRELLGATRERMLREMAEALEVLTTKTPLVLAIEDLQWSDYSTLDLIAFLARQREPARLLLIGTYRPVDVIVSQHPLKVVKQELQVHGQCTELPLELLIMAEVLEYLRVRFPNSTLPEELAWIIHQRTDGNPLFMVNVVESLVAQEGIVQCNGRWELRTTLGNIEVGVPENIRQMIEQQFERLSAAEQQTLGAASVVGVKFSTAAVAAALETEVAQVEERCEELARRAHFLRSCGFEEWPDRTVAGCYEFIHALYQNVLYQRIAATRRLRLHQKIGERKEVAYDQREGEIAAELAMHFEQGRDYRRAVQYLRQAAENAARRYANREVVSYLTRVLELIERLPAEERVRLQMTVLEQRGLVRRAMGNMKQAAEDFAALATCARHQGQSAGEVKALLYLASALSWANLEQSLAVAEQAATLSRHLQDELLQAHTRSLYGYWRSLVHGWREEDARACAHAVEMARQAGDRALLSVHLGRHAYFQCFQSAYRAACDAAEEGLQMAQPGGDASDYLTCQIFRSWALLHLGRWGEMVRILKDGMEMAEKNGHYLQVMLFRLQTAWLSEQAYDFARVRELCEPVLAQAGEAQYGLGQLLSLGLLGVAYRGLEQPERAFQCFSELTRRLEHGHIVIEWVQMPVRHSLSEYWLTQGEFTRARQEAGRLCELAAHPGERTYLALGQRMLAEIALAERKWEQAEVAVSQALAVLEGAEAPLAEWRVCATAAQLYQRRGDKAEARIYWTRSAAVLKQLADSLSEVPALRESLLNSPPVRGVLRRARIDSQTPLQI